MATELDHSTPLAQGGAKFSSANLQPLCKPCHIRKTNTKWITRVFMTCPNRGYKNLSQPSVLKKRARVEVLQRQDVDVAPPKESPARNIRPSDALKIPGEE